MTPALSSGSGARKRLFWSVALLSAAVLGVLWASGVDAENRKNMILAAMAADSAVVLGIAVLLWKVRRAQLAR